MGSQIRSCLSNGVYVVNGVPILRNSPSKCLNGVPQTVTFRLERDKLKIWHDYDDMTNTESAIASHNFSVTLAKNDKSLVTRVAVIASTVKAILSQIDLNGTRTVVFADPRTSEEAIFEAIFRGL